MITMFTDITGTDLWWAHETSSLRIIEKKIHKVISDNSTFFLLKHQPLHHNHMYLTGRRTSQMQERYFSIE